MGQSAKLTIPVLINYSVKTYSEHTSLVFTGEKNYTYKELGNDIQLMSEYLIESGIQKGDKVAILSTNMPNWGVAFFAISVIGAIAVPILPDFHSKEIKTILEHSGAQVLFISEGLYGKVSKDVLEYCKQVILVDNLANVPLNTPINELLDLETSLPKTIKGLKNPEVEEEDLASIIYTSGTTGSSKGVMLTHKNLAWTTQQCSELQKVVPADRFISILPLSHSLENTVGFLLPVKYGASVHYLRKPPVASVLMPALQLVKPTIMLAVPLIMEKIFKLKILPKFQKSPIIRGLYSLTPIRKLLHRLAGKKLMETFGGQIHFFGIGGAKLDATVERFLIEAKFPYAIGYGLTETSPLLSGAVGKNRELGSAGIAMPGVTLRIGDKDPVTGQGEVQAMGENVMKGYYKAPEITKEVFTDDGWFKTGDLGIIDKNGMLSLKGRIKSMIVGASGENIYPEEIESVINKMRFVLESIVVQKKGKLVAMIHLNVEEIENHIKNFKSEAKNYVHNKADSIQLKSEEIIKEIQEKVNLEVNKFSRIQMVVLQTAPFEKTPTKKIKRFLYY